MSCRSKTARLQRHSYKSQSYRRVRLLTSRSSIPHSTHDASRNNRLAPFPNTLMNKNSCHVWNRLLTQPNPPAFYRRLAEVGTGSWSAIVRDDGGSLIVQHLLEDWNEVHSSIVAREILENLEDVATTACGSLWVTFASLEPKGLWRTEVCSCTAFSLLSSRRTSYLSVLVFSNSHLVSPSILLELRSSNESSSLEKSLQNSWLSSSSLSSQSPSEQTFPSSLPLLGRRLADFWSLDYSGEQEPLLLAVASHVSGANLLAYLLTTSVAPYNDKAKLVRCITAHAPKLLAEGGAHSANLVGLVGKAWNRCSFTVRSSR